MRTLEVLFLAGGILSLYDNSMTKEKTTEYRVHDPEGCIDEEFSDLDKAIEFANECCQEHLDDCWSPEVENITVSKVIYRANKCEIKLKSDCKPDKDEGLVYSDGEPWPNNEWDEVCNYKMSAVQ